MKITLACVGFLMSFSLFAVPGTLLRELCPFCETQNDGTILFPNGLDSFYKMKVIRFDRERISVRFLAETDETGKPYATSIKFRNQHSREAFTRDLKNSCASFLGYKYYASGLHFIKGSHRSSPTEETKATFDLTCWRKKESIIARFFNFLDRKVDGDRSARIFDDLRSSGKDVPIRTYRVKESSSIKR